MTRALSKRTVLFSELVICSKPVYRLIGFTIAYHGLEFPLRSAPLSLVAFGLSISDGETVDRRFNSRMDPWSVISRVSKVRRYESWRSQSNWLR